MNGSVVFMAVMALVSGLAKTIRRGRRRDGLPLLAVVELLAGMIVLAVAFTGSVGRGMGAVILFCLFVLVVTSTGTEMRTARERRLRRQATEAARLRAHVDYFWKLGSGEGGPKPEQEE